MHYDYWIKSMNTIGSFDNFYFDQPEPGVATDTDSASDEEESINKRSAAKGPPIKKTLLNSETYIPMAKSDKIKTVDKNISNAESETPPAKKATRKRKATSQENSTQSPSPKPTNNSKTQKKKEVSKTQVTVKRRTLNRRQQKKLEEAQRNHNQDLRAESENLKQQIGNIFTHLGKVYFSLD